VEQDAVDLVGFGVDPRRRGEAPLFLAALDPAGERSAAGEDLVEQIEGFAGKVEEDLAGRQAHRPIAERGTEGGVAVHHHVPGPEAERGRARRNGAGPVPAGERLTHDAILEGAAAAIQSDSVRLTGPHSVISFGATLVLAEWGMRLSPRRYRMAARAGAIGETRRRIVEAAKVLHADQGVVATSWEDIAAGAGLSTATVYRHFPGLAELIPACAQSVFDLIKPPTAGEAAVRFSALGSATKRLEHLVRESCRCYREGEGWLHAAHRERDFVPSLDQALVVIEDSLEVLVAAAVGEKVSPKDHSELFVLCDFPFWKSLIDSGLRYNEAEALIVRLVTTEAARAAEHKRR
jgi:AcrR family transcriptional regulator